MNRLDELTLGAADRGLDPAEAAELAALLADEGARARHAALLDVEAALRGDGLLPDVADAAVRAADAARAGDLERAVMRAVSALPPPGPEAAPAPRPARRWAAPAAAAAAAVAAAVLVWVASRPHPPGDDPRPDPGPDRSAVAMLADGTPDVVLETPAGEPTPPTAGQWLAADQTVRTGAADGAATLRFADGSRVELFGDTTARLEPAPDGGHRVRLVEGGLRVEVRPRGGVVPLVVLTPHATVRAVGPRFGVTALADQGTRVYAEAGTVQVFRGDTPTEVLAGGSAFVPPGAAPVVVSGRPRSLTDPARETAFPGLRGFAVSPDGATVAGFTARQVVSWRPAADGLVAERLGPRKSGYDTPAAAGPFVLLRDPTGKRVGAFDLFRRDGGPTAADPEPALQVACVSPTGGWWAYWNPGRSGVRVAHADGRPVVEYPFPGKNGGVTASPDGRVLAAGRKLGDGYVVDLVDPAAGVSLGHLPVKHPAPFALDYSAGGDRLAVGLIGRVQVWDVPAKRLVAEHHHPGYRVLRVACSGDGRRVAAGGSDDRVWVWDAGAPGEPLAVAVGSAPRGFAFAPDGRSLVVLDRTDRLTVWDLPE